MKLVLALLLMLSTCKQAWHTPQELRITLSVADQVCVGKQGWTPVTVWVHQTGGSEEVTLRLEPGGQTFHLLGPVSQLNLEKVGLGGHVVTASTSTQEARKAFTVWDCTPAGQIN